MANLTELLEISMELGITYIKNHVPEKYKL